MVCFSGGLGGGGGGSRKPGVYVSHILRSEIFVMLRSFVFGGNADVGGDSHSCDMLFPIDTFLDVFIPLFIILIINHCHHHGVISSTSYHGVCPSTGIFTAVLQCC